VIGELTRFPLRTGGVCLDLRFVLEEGCPGSHDTASGGCADEDAVRGSRSLRGHPPKLTFVVHEDPGPDLPAHQARWIERLQLEASGELGFVVVLRPDNPPPKETARATIRRAFEQYSGTMGFGAIVVEKSGFTAAAQRSALSVIILASRTPYPLKVFSSVDEACRWISGRATRTARAAHRELVDAVESLKKAYHAGTLRAEP
jgi:hypothetical protein